MLEAWALSWICCLYSTVDEYMYRASVSIFSPYALIMVLPLSGFVERSVNYLHNFHRLQVIPRSAPLASVWPWLSGILVFKWPFSQNQDLSPSFNDGTNQGIYVSELNRHASRFCYVPGPQHIELVTQSHSSFSREPTSLGPTRREAHQGWEACCWYALDENGRSGISWQCSGLKVPDTCLWAQLMSRCFQRLPRNWSRKAH